MEISLLNQVEKFINSKDPKLTALKFNEYMNNQDHKWAAKNKNDLFTECLFYEDTEETRKKFGT